MSQLSLPVAPLLTVGVVDRIHRSRVDAYVTLCRAGADSLDLRHRRNPPETAEQRAAMNDRLAQARLRFAAAADAWDAVDEASRDQWAQWVNGGRK